MPSPMSALTLACLSLVGAGAGVFLGRDAVGEINPIYFSERATSWHADLAANQPPAWETIPASSVTDAELGIGLGSGCVGCREYPEEYYPRHDESVDYDNWSGSASAPAEVMPASIGNFEPVDDPDRRAIEAYSTYPVSAAQEAADFADASAVMGSDSH